MQQDQPMYVEEFGFDKMKDSIIYLLCDVEFSRQFKHIIIHKNTIIHYFEKHQLDAKSYLNTKSRSITREIVAIIGNRKLTAKLLRLFRNLTDYIIKMTIDCKPMQRI
eukprot:970587_1